jgi:modification methylase
MLKKRIEMAKEEERRVLKELSLYSIELTFKERKARGFWK